MISEHREKAHLSPRMKPECSTYAQNYEIPYEGERIEAVVSDKDIAKAWADSYLSKEEEK